jgi:hypothetical protein
MTPTATIDGVAAETLIRLLQKKGATLEAEVRGASMEPGIPNNTIVRIRLQQTTSYATGSVILFRYAGKLVLHRLAYSAAEHCIAQGDARWLADPPVSINDVLGEVVGCYVAGEWRAPAWQCETGAHRCMQALFRAPVIAAMHVHLAPARAIARGLIWLCALPRTILRSVTPAAVAQRSAPLAQPRTSAEDGGR